MSKRGFTLIEMLCVITIVVSLAAILFPVLANARLAAKVSTDLGQLSQIGKAMQLYAADYDDRTPYAITERDRADGEFQDETMPLDQWNVFKLTIPAVNVCLGRYGATPELFHSPIDQGCGYGANRPAPNCFLKFGSSYAFEHPGRALTSFPHPSKTVYSILHYTPAQPETVNDFFNDAVYMDGHAAKTVGFANFGGE